MEENNIGNIYIRDLIGDCKDYLGIFLIDVIKQVKAQPLATSFKVFINTKGGDVIEATRIKAYLESLREEKGLKIMTIAEAECYSSGTIIHKAGDVGLRMILPNGKFMIHLISGGVSGNAEQIAEYSKDILAINDELAKSYAKEYDLPSEIVLDLMREEIFLTAQDCQDLGIATIYNETPIVARAKDSDK